MNTRDSWWYETVGLCTKLNFIYNIITCNQSWEGYFGTVIGYRLQVTLFKM